MNKYLLTILIPIIIIIIYPFKIKGNPYRIPNTPVLVTDGVETAKPKEPLKYNAKPNKLKYSFRTILNMNRGFGDKDPSGLFSNRMSGGLYLNGHFFINYNNTSNNIIIQNDKFTQGHKMNAIQLPGNIIKKGYYADAYLTCDGNRFTEHDGPTSLWNAFGSFPGFYVYFPELPKSNKIGEVTKWKVRMYDRNAPIKIEAKRGNFKIPDNIEITKIKLEE